MHKHRCLRCLAVWEHAITGAAMGAQPGTELWRAHECPGCKATPMLSSFFSYLGTETASYTNHHTAPASRDPATDVMKEEPPF
jgi:rubredoxin